jgi:hypothetical protein
LARKVKKVRVAFAERTASYVSCAVWRSNIHVASPAHGYCSSVKKEQTLLHRMHTASLL